MPWFHFAFLGTGVTPLSSVTGDAISYLLSFGPLGIGVVLFGLGYIVPKAAMTSAIMAARVDLLEENERLRTEKAHAEEQRDEALQFAQTQLVPLLTSFTATTAALLPLLQEAVRAREDRRDETGRLR